MPLLLRLCLRIVDPDGAEMMMWLSYSVISTTTASDVIRFAQRTVCERLGASLAAPVGELTLCIRDIFMRFVAVGTLASSKNEVPITTMRFFEELLRANRENRSSSSMCMGGDGAWQKFIVIQGVLAPTKVLRHLDVPKSAGTTHPSCRCQIVEVPSELGKEPLSVDDPLGTSRNSLVSYTNETAFASPKLEVNDNDDSVVINSSASEMRDSMSVDVRHVSVEGEQHTITLRAADLQSLETALLKCCEDLGPKAGYELEPSRMRLMYSTEENTQSFPVETDMVLKQTLENPNVTCLSLVERSQVSNSASDTATLSERTGLARTRREPIDDSSHEPFADVTPMELRRNTCVIPGATPKKPLILKHVHTVPPLPAFSSLNDSSPVENSFGPIKANGKRRTSDLVKGDITCSNSELASFHRDMDEALGYYYRIVEENNRSIGMLQHQVSSLTNELEGYNNAEQDCKSLEKILERLRMNVGRGESRQKGLLQELDEL
ncbi:hypothetical protein, conserved [Trypanosoma brucei gambiense DAL972]|uniref:Uncharacterized protein n=1 Tax=Trypanosoma brucei gambiense (strain MHOM/CI/86/DAL972) TaxID=679716 RepID=C9ZP83_TRYB9|nr:hypothetical protein, conserved [Trypanosoma brucei gambiense DAL972]CBH11211.1 hypothetical protein, conserved [Trypanosoma brucei gambiense DAL972]|eukprot:XP_011773498.1 hypothetical protein, conserved [Trypanosoma brucei gambiense DAL972]